MSKLFSNKLTYILIAIFTITFLLSSVNISYARQTTGTQTNTQEENVLEIPDFDDGNEDDDEIDVSEEDNEETNVSSPTTTSSSLSTESNQSSSATVSSLTLVPDDSLGFSTIVSIVLAVVGVVLILLGIAILLKLGKR